MFFEWYNLTIFVGNSAKFGCFAVDYFEVRQATRGNFDTIFNILGVAEVWCYNIFSCRTIG